jgi:hypothetical protein
MKKQLSIAVGVLFTLGTAVSASLNDAAEPTKQEMTVESVAPHFDSKQSAQIVALWNTHATSSGSVPLARPL